MEHFAMLRVAAAVLGALPAAPVLILVARRRARSRKRRDFGFGDAASVGVWMLTTWVLLTAAARVLGATWFGMVHVLFLGVAFGIPTTGLLTLAFARWGVPWVGRVKFRAAPLAAAWLALLVGLAAGYARFVEPFWLQTERADFQLAALRGSGGPITVGVLADLQFAEVTDYERAAVERLMALRPDIIVLPGDLFQGSERSFREQLDAIRALLAPLQAPGGVFITEGNVDRTSRLRAAIEGTRVRLLANEIVVVDVRGRKIAIAGVPCQFDDDAARRCIRRLTAEHGDADVRVLLSHRPDAVLQLTEADRVDLTISGHTHGGQIRIPFLGPPVTLSDVPRQAAGGGASVVNGHNLYVSRGIGLERGESPPVRFNCPPEISLLTLSAGE